MKIKDTDKYGSKEKYNMRAGEKPKATLIGLRTYINVCTYLRRQM